MDGRPDSLDDPNPWDEYATDFARFVARREQQDLERDPILMAMLPLLGDVRGKRVLDACCGEGFFSRVIASRGAHVTGMDLSPRLIEMAREKDSNNTIEYRVGDLSQRFPELEGNFDHIGSHLALNDVDDYQGFAANLVALVKPRGRIVIAFNNPYSLVVRGHITDYFDEGARGLYGGFSQLGIQARSYHRTLESYLDAFLSSGLRLIKLVDVLQDRLGREWLLPKECRFPLFMILAFEKPIVDVPVDTETPVTGRRQPRDRCVITRRVAGVDDLRMTSRIKFRFDKDFPLDAWLALFHASDYNVWRVRRK